MYNNRMKLPQPKTEHLFYVEIRQDGDIEIEGRSSKHFLMSPIAGGYFEGDKLKGKVAAIGTGYTTSSPPNKNEIEIRLLLQTDDGIDIMMESQGFLLIEPSQEELIIGGASVDAADYYYRFHVKFQTASTKYAWLNDKCCFSIAGIKDWQTVCCEVYAIS